MEWMVILDVDSATAKKNSSSLTFGSSSSPPSSLAAKLELEKSIEVTNIG